MDINLLALNVGNSRLAIGVFASGKLESVRRVPIADQAAWPAAITDAWQLITGKEDASVAGATVNPLIVEPLEHITEKITKQPVAWVGKDLDLPIAVKTDQPAETGIDRVLNIAAAYEQMEKACVVVDAGTAITINFCNDKGDFVGGSISPGVGMMLDALHNRTAKLPRIEFARPEGAIGKNTREAILHGIYHGVRGMLKEIVENYATELGTWPDIIATGGDAAILFEGWELIHAIAPDLTLYGIALAFTEHQIRHDK